MTIITLTVIFAVLEIIRAYAVSKRNNSKKPGDRSVSMSKGKEENDIISDSVNQRTPKATEGENIDEIRS